jgi:hypothetical protein
MPVDRALYARAEHGEKEIEDVVGGLRDGSQCCASAATSLSWSSELPRCSAGARDLMSDAGVVVKPSLVPVFVVVEPATFNADPDYVCAKLGAAAASVKRVFGRGDS